MKEGKKIKMLSDIDRNNESRVQALQKKYDTMATSNAKAMGKKVKSGSGGEEERVPVHYAVYGRLSADPDKVRKHLDAGILAKLLTKYQAKLRTSYTGYDRAGYSFILLGACAMSLGCQLPEATVSLMKKHYSNLGLMRIAKKQMEKALDEKTGYKNGKAWDFGSQGLRDTMESGGPPKEDRLFPNAMNVEEPGSTATSTADLGRKLAEQLTMANAMEATKHGPNGCGGCGAKEGKDGAELFNCGRCKKTKYCSKECQTKHWNLHKTICKALAKCVEPGKSYLTALEEL